MDKGKRITIMDLVNHEVHVFKLPKKFWGNPGKFIESKCSEHGETFKLHKVSYIVTELERNEGRLPIFIH